MPQRRLEQVQIGLRFDGLEPSAALLFPASGQLEELLVDVNELCAGRRRRGRGQAGGCREGKTEEFSPRERMHDRLLLDDRRAGIEDHVLVDHDKQSWEGQSCRAL